MVIAAAKAVKKVALIEKDLPELALFAYTILKHLGRLPGYVEASVHKIMPHRLAHFKVLFTGEITLKKK